MADTPQNPQNQGTPGLDKTLADLLSIKKLRQESLEIEGDYNNLTKQTLKELEKESKLYIKIAAKIEAMNQSSINVKEVQRELNKLTQKEFTDKKKIEQLQKELSEDTKKQIQNQKVLESLFSKAITEQQRERVQKQIDLNNAKLQANQELQYIEYQKVKAKITEQEKNNMSKILETEKAVSKEMGLTGKLAKNFADKLGVGESVYEAMVLQSRNNVDAIENGGKKSSVLVAGLKAAKQAMLETWNSTSGWGKAAILVAVTYKAVSASLNKIGEATKKAGSTLKGMSEDSGNVFSGLTSGFSSFISKIPLVGGLLSGVVDGFASILDLITGIDDKFVKAGRQIGLSADQARQLNRHFQDVSYNSGNIFINSKKLLESQVELNKEMGVNVQLSDEQLQTNTMLKDLAGLELDTRTAITNTSIITGKSANSITKSVLAQVVGLKSATGISFNYQKVLKEAASQSGYLGLQFAKYPEKLTKSLLTVKSLGMDLKQLDSIADSFLDFESSISKEFEAQLLTGKQINLQKARELFLNNDLAGAAMEINKQIGSSKDFLKLNRIAAESLAGALGMSRDQLGDMLQKQELYSKLGAKEGTNQRELLKIGLERYKNQKKLSEAIGEEAYQSLVTGSTQEKMAAMIEKIKQSIVDFVEKTNIIEKIENFINSLTNPTNVKKILDSVKGFMANAIEFMTDVASKILGAIDTLIFWKDTGLSELAKNIKEGGKQAAESIRSVGGGISMTPETVAQSAASTTTGGQAKSASIPKGQFSKDRIVINNTIEFKQDAFSTEKTRLVTQTIDPGLHHSDNSSNPTYKKN
jgi:hypothetical protein